MSASLRMEIWCRDLAESIEFYRDVVGLEVVSQSPEGYTVMKRDRVIISLNKVENFTEDNPIVPLGTERHGLATEFVLEVSDLDDCYRRALEADVVQDEMMMRPWGLRDFRVLDPDGFYIRFTTPPQ